jgi:hypothetical protein
MIRVLYPSGWPEARATKDVRIVVAETKIPKPWSSP